jgi:hypothetical protein
MVMRRSACRHSLRRHRRRSPEERTAKASRKPRESFFHVPRQRQRGRLAQTQNLGVLGSPGGSSPAPFTRTATHFRTRLCTERRRARLAQIPKSWRHRRLGGSSPAPFTRRRRLRRASTPCVIINQSGPKSGALTRDFGRRSNAKCGPSEGPKTAPRFAR